MQNFARDEFAYRLPHYEYVNVIYMLVNHYYNALKKDIDMVVFEDIPHGGSGLVMYYVAKAMGINTLLLIPTYDTEHFLYCYSIEDYGIFSDNPKTEFYPMIEEIKMSDPNASQCHLKTDFFSFFSPLSKLCRCR